MSDLVSDPSGAYLVVAGLVFAGYFVSLVLHPFRSCHSCGGSGRQRGSVFSYAFRSCTSCGGTGRHLRWGSQLFGISGKVGK